MLKKNALKIILPLCIVLIVAGIWIYKYMQNNVPVQESLTGNPDFALEADVIDLKQLTSYGLPIIIDFGAGWCAPCREFAPILKAMNAEMQGLAIIKYVDVDESGETAADFPIQVIPTQVFITADGKPYVPSDNIAVEFSMYADRDTGEHAFTIHQGGLTEDEMRVILADMGVNQ
jgi:thioredoxin 1